MPAPRSPLAELPHRCRQWLAACPQRWHAWRADLREDPTLLWRTPVIRLGGLVLAGVVLLAVIQGLVGAFTPAGTPGAFQKATRTATLYVACTNPDCLASFVVRQPMDFKDWPLACPRCDRQTAYRATVCQTCGHWFAVAPGGIPACPHCARRNADLAPPARRAPPASSDDDEDPW